MEDSRIQSLFEKMADQYSHRVQLEKWHDDGSATITIFNERDVLISESRLSWHTFNGVHLVHIWPQDGRVDLHISPIASAVIAVLTR
jgi:S-adenosylmethionine/arginine decarboxylase-like enzyme